LQVVVVVVLHKAVDMVEKAELQEMNRGLPQQVELVVELIYLLHYVKINLVVVPSEHRLARVQGQARQIIHLISPLMTWVWAAAAAVLVVVAVVM
jgi:hypothetical protein